MSVATPSTAGRRGGTAGTVWVAFLVLIVAALALAWFGAGSLRPEVTQSGLQFRTIAAGTGPTIQPADAALLDYILTTSDGTVFDSSETHGGPQPFTMDQVFPGFAEAMKRMQVGGQYRFTMPQKLAFSGASPPGWPKDSPLTFDVRVRKVVPGGAAMMQQQMMQQQMQQQQGGPPSEGAPQQ